MTVDMNDYYTDELPLAELAANPDRALGKGASQATLHYCSPAHGGWGVVRVALLVPESHLLFVCPPACGRHGAIAAIEQGCKKKISYLCISDHEIVLGGYEAEIERGAREVMSRVKPRPRALMLFMSCIDDLLATDHTAAIRRMEAEHGIPLRLARMDPISLDNKLPPGIRVQKTMYEFLDIPVDKDRGVIILGAYRPPPQDSELSAILRMFGFGPVRHPEYCPDFASFRRMSQSAAALLLRPEGGAAAQDLSSRLGIPVCKSFMAFDKDTIMERYRSLFAFLETFDYTNGTKGPQKTADTERAKTGEMAMERAESFLAAARKKAEEREGQARAVLGDTRLAIDATATIAPFNLALALVKAGLNVRRIYANQLPEFERPSLMELSRRKDDILVANPNHARKHGPRPAEPLADMAVGFEAGYATAAPVTVPLAFDEQLFGFEGYTKALDMLIQAAEEGKTDLRRQLSEYGLVV
jgi:hypothetical protein